eukprot:8141644-Prorocentrum_lima.AAC.1
MIVSEWWGVVLGRVRCNEVGHWEEEGGWLCGWRTVGSVTGASATASKWGDAGVGGGGSVVSVR